MDFCKGCLGGMIEAGAVPPLHPFNKAVAEADCQFPPHKELNALRKKIYLIEQGGER